MATTRGRAQGYHRDDHGRWRYDHDNRLVPGARDVTIDRLWRFPRAGDAVAVPVEVIVVAAELSWCRPYTAGRRHRVRWLGRTVDAVAVPLSDWNDHAHEPLGIDAPELAPDRLLDISAIAELLGISASGVRANVVRGYLPAPTITHLSSPLWSLPILSAWLARRRGSGHKVEGRARHRRAPADRRPAPPDEFLATIDAMLARHMPDDQPIDGLEPLAPEPGR